MDLQWIDDETGLAEGAAAQVAALLAAKPQAAVALATGRTPRGLYRRLVQRHEAGSLPSTPRASSIWTSSSACGRRIREATRPISGSISCAAPCPADSGPAAAGRCRRSRGGMPGLRRRSGGGGRARSGHSGAGDQWPYRLQRTRGRLECGDPCGDAGPLDAPGPAPSLRQRGRDPDPGSDHGHRHDPRGAQDPAAGDGRGQGGCHGGVACRQARSRLAGDSLAGSPRPHRLRRPQAGSNCPLRPCGGGLGWGVDPRPRITRNLERSGRGLRIPATPTPALPRQSAGLTARRGRVKKVVSPPMLSNSRLTKCRNRPKQEGG